MRLTNHSVRRLKKILSELGAIRASNAESLLLCLSKSKWGAEDILIMLNFYNKEFNSLTQGILNKGEIKDFDKFPACLDPQYHHHLDIDFIESCLTKRGFVEYLIFKLFKKRTIQEINIIKDGILQKERQEIERIKEELETKEKAKNEVRKQRLKKMRIERAKKLLEKEYEIKERSNVGA